MMIIMIMVNIFMMYVRTHVGDGMNTRIRSVCYKLAVSKSTETACFLVTTQAYYYFIRKKIVKFGEGLTLKFLEDGHFHLEHLFRLFCRLNLESNLLLRDQIYAFVDLAKPSSTDLFYL